MLPQSDSFATVLTLCSLGCPARGNHFKQKKSSPIGKFQPTKGANGKESCLDCAVSQYAANEGAVECEYCPTGRTSLQGSPTCSLAAVNYFLQEPKTRSSSVPAETAP